MRYFINIFFSKLVRRLNFTTSKIKKLRFVQKLKWFRTKESPNLCDDFAFLNYVYKKKIGFEKNIKTISTLAIRASTADYGFYSPLWKGSFNLGLISSDLFNTYHIYNNYRENLPNLKNLIIFFSVPTPGFSLIHTSERYRTVAYKYFFQVPYSIPEIIDPKYEQIILKKCRSLKNPKFTPDYVGYETKTYYGIHISAEERTRTHIRENKREPDQMDWLKSLMNVVVSDNRRLIVVIPSFRSDYKSLLPDESILFEKLYRLESAGLEIISYYNSKLFDDSDFGDVDHLNESGAFKMTSDLLRIFETRSW